MREAEIEDPPDAGDVTADCRIHEPRKQRHRADVEDAGFRIGPRAGSSLEQFHHRADDVEDQDEQIMGILEYLTEWLINHILYVDAQIPQG